MDKNGGIGELGMWGTEIATSIFRTEVPNSSEIAVRSSTSTEPNNRRK
jgi:hypothetical protein